MFFLHNYPKEEYFFLYHLKLKNLCFRKNNLKNQKADLFELCKLVKFKFFSSDIISINHF